MAGSLEFIKQVTHSGSNVNSIDVTDIFSADYDVYQIQINDLVYDSPAYFYVRLLDSSNTVITTGYSYAELLMDTGSTWSERKSASTSILLSAGYFGSGTVNSQVNTLRIFNPFSSSSYTFATSQGYGHFGTRGNGDKGIGSLNATTSCAGISIVTQTAGVYFTAGKIIAYGVK
jgi:hypothetical protein